MDSDSDQKAASETLPFDQWLDNTATEITSDSDTIVATSIASVRQSLLHELRQDQSDYDHWLAVALKQTEAVFTCSGVVEIGTLGGSAGVSVTDGNAEVKSQSHSEGNDSRSSKRARVTSPPSAEITNASNVRMAFIRPSTDSSASINTPPLTEISAYQLTLPFPLATKAADVDGIMTKIVQLCRPATFGVGGEAVLDLSYRSCHQLSPEQFWSSFTPNDCQPSILHEIMRVLCPSTSPIPIVPSLRAELYKLNIYSVGGLFKSHRDTPRSTSMMGSLVVCLPIPHEGGALIVRQDERQVKYDWSFSLDNDNAEHQKKRHQLQWCAFYGDCEHEILPVTAGHRVTLTYNLYINTEEDTDTETVEEEKTQTTGTNTAIATNTSNTRFLDAPFPALMCLLLRSSLFMPEGGKLGIYCHHGYAHTSAAMQKVLSPRLLKGGDAVLYESVRALGLRCDFVPVVSGDYVLENFQRTDTSHNMADDNEYDEDGEPMEMGIKMSKDIRWLNQGDGVSELQEARAAYGNEPSMGTCYSKAAFIVHVPKWNTATNARARSAPVSETSEVRMPQHPHLLKWMKRSKRNWRCDVCRQRKRGSTGRWRCSSCVWDACVDCQKAFTAENESQDENEDGDDSDSEEEEDVEN